MKNLKLGHEKINRDACWKIFEKWALMLSLSSYTKQNWAFQRHSSRPFSSLHWKRNHVDFLHNMSNVNETVNAEVVAVFISESTVIEKEHGNKCSWSHIELTRSFSLTILLFISQSSLCLSLMTNRNRKLVKFILIEAFVGNGSYRHRRALIYT